MTDPFDDFARSMDARTAKVRQQERAQLNADQAYRDRFKAASDRELADIAVLSAMKDYPLKRGQMLLLGPKSVALLSTPGAFAGTLPDKLVLERKEWCPNHT